MLSLNQGGTPRQASIHGPRLQKQFFSSRAITPQIMTKFSRPALPCQYGGPPNSLPAGSTGMPGEIHLPRLDKLSDFVSKLGILTIGPTRRSGSTHMFRKEFLLGNLPTLAPVFQPMLLRSVNAGK